MPRSRYGIEMGLPGKKTLLFAGADFAFAVCSAAAAGWHFVSRERDGCTARFWHAQRSCRSDRNATLLRLKRI